MKEGMAAFSTTLKIFSGPSISCEISCLSDEMLYGSHCHTRAKSFRHMCLVQLRLHAFTTSHHLRFLQLQPEALRLLKSAALPRTRKTENCWNSCWTVTVSSSPVCLANKLPSSWQWEGETEFLGGSKSPTTCPACRTDRPPVTPLLKE